MGLNSGGGLSSRVLATAALIAALILVGVPAAGQYLGMASEVELESFYTRVYGLVGFSMPNDMAISDAAFSTSLNTLIVAGEAPDVGPMVAGIDTSRMVVEWSQALVGQPLFVEIDSSSGSWAAVATSAGEVAVISLEDPGLRADFYTASRAEVAGLAVSTAGGSPVVAAVDVEGSAYIANPSLPGWIEFSPSGNRGMLAGYVTPPMVGVITEETLQGWGSWSSGPRAFLVMYAAQTGPLVSSSGDGYYDDLDARVRATLFFELAPDAIVPAKPRTLEDPERSVVTVYTLYMAVAPSSGKGLVLAPNWYHVEGDTGNSFDEATGLTLLGSENLDVLVPASDVRLVFIYTEEQFYVDPEGSSTLLSFTCYSTERLVDLEPGGEIDLDIVIMKPAAGAESLEECADLHGLTLGTQPYQPLLAVDLRADQWGFEYTRDARIVWVPLTQDLGPGFSGSTLARLFTLSKPSPLEGVDSLLLVGSSAGYLHVYYLDSNGNPAESLPSPQTIYLGGAPTEVVVEPDGSRILVGTERGHVFLLEYSSIDRQFWVSRAMAVAGSPVVSIALAGDGAALTVSEDGVLQMIDLDAWEPLWRNLPGFIGVLTGLSNPIVVSPTAAPALIVSLGEPSLYTFTPAGLDLNPVMIDLQVLVEGEAGERIASPQDLGVDSGGEARIVGAGGEVYAVDVDVWSRGEILLYTPRGSYTLEVDLGSLGSLSKPIQVAGGEVTEDSITVVLREVSVRVVVPDEPPVEAYRLAYELYSGPAPGVELVLTPTYYEESLGYTPQPAAVSGLTGDDGALRAVLWRGVEYSVEGSSDFVSQVAGVVQPDAVGVVDVQAELLVLQINVRALDAEAYREGVEYDVDVSRITVARSGVERVAEAPGPARQLYLPPGSYTVTIEASGYEPAVVEFEVGGRGAPGVVALLEPGSWSVTVDPRVVDTAGRDAGSLREARVTLTLVEPAIEYEVSGETGEDGLASFSVRPGVYSVRVEHPSLGSVVLGGVEVWGDTVVVVPFRVEESRLRISIMDAELGVEAVGSFDVELTYAYTGYTFRATVEGSLLELDLPSGLYTASIVSREGYYEPHQEMSLSLPPGGFLEVNAWLEPVKIPVLIEAYYRDEQGIASGGVGGAVITATPVETPFDIPPETIQTGPDGTALLYLRPGVYSIEVVHGTTKPASTSLDLFGAGREGVAVRVGLEPIYGTLELVAVDSETGIELPEVFFRVVWSGYTTSTERVVRAEGGRAEITAPLGSYIVEASLPTHYRSSVSQVTLIQERALARLSLEPIKVELEVRVLYREVLATISGNTVLLPQSPAPNAMVVIEPRDPVLEAQGVQPIAEFTDESGSVRLVLRAGSYVATASSGESREVQEVRVTEGSGLVTLTIAPQLGEAVLAAVDPDIEGEGRLVEGAVLEILEYNGVPLDQPVSVEAPAEAFIPPGVYTVRIYSEGYVEAVRLVEVPAGGGLVEIALEPFRVDLSLSVEADFLGERVQVLGGLLVFRSLSLEGLKPVEVEISGGQAQASLRPGEYEVVYRAMIGDSEYELSAGVLEVGPGASTASITLIPQPIAVEVTPLDAEFEIPITVFQVRLVYEGPFGGFETIIEGSKGEVLIQAPPGYFRIELSAPGYKPEVLELSAVASVDIEARMEAVLFNASINLVDPDGRPVEGEVEVVVRHTELPIRVEKRIAGPILRLDEVRPGVYIVEVNPVGRQDLVKTTARITISPEGRVEPGVIEVAYTTYLVELRLVDASTGELVDFPHIASIERIPPEGGEELLVETVIQGSTLITLPPGTYRVTLTPEGGESFYNVDVPFTFTVSQDTAVDLRVSPIVYAVTVVVVDDRGDPLAGAFVRVTTADGRDVAAGTTDVNGNFTFQAPFGVYTVEAAKPGYREAVGAINVPQSMLITLELEPGPQVLAMRYGPIAVGLAGLALIAGLIYRVRDRIARRIMEEEEYF